MTLTQHSSIIRVPIRPRFLSRGARAHIYHSLRYHFRLSLSRFLSLFPEFPLYKATYVQYWRDPRFVNSTAATVGRFSRAAGRITHGRLRSARQPTVFGLRTRAPRCLQQYCRAARKHKSSGSNITYLHSLLVQNTSAAHLQHPPPSHELSRVYLRAYTARFTREFLEMWLGTKLHIIAHIFFFGGEQAPRNDFMAVTPGILLPPGAVGVQTAPRYYLQGSLHILAHGSAKFCSCEG